MGKARKGSHQPIPPDPAPPPPAAATAVLPIPARRLRRVWFFRMMALVFPFCCVALAEWSLRLAGQGIDPRLVQQSVRNPAGDVHYLNPRVDVAYCRDDLRGPEPRGFVLPRPAAVLRVIVVGESSVQGYPYPSEVAFPRQMEFLLQRQLDDQKVEVLNAGIVGVSGLPLSDLVQQCAAAEPSVIVVYAGHNEFYGVGGVATNAQLSPLGLSLRKTRLAQWWSAGAPSDPARASQTAAGPLISRLPTEIRIPPSSPLVQQAWENFQSRMESIAVFCTRKHIPLLLCAPVSNLRSQSPWADSDLLTTLQAVEQRVGAPLSAATSGAYLSELQTQTTEHPEDAILQFRLAQCLELTGDNAGAQRSYELARDLDQCRYRAPSTYRDALREIASQSSIQAAYLDLEPIFCAQSVHGIPGDELFLEHVHFTFAGHWLMAQAISQQLVEETLGRTWDASRVPSDAERDEWLGLVPEDHLVALYLASFIGEELPFSQSLDAKDHAVALKSKIAALEQSLDPERLQRFHSLPNPVKTDDLIDGLGRMHLGLNDPQSAFDLFQRSTRRRPWMPNGYVFCAVAAQMQGHLTQSRDSLLQSTQTVIPETPRLLSDRERLERILRRSAP